MGPGCLESNLCVMCQMVTTGAVLEGGWGVFIPQHPDPNDPSRILNVNGGNMYWIRKSNYNILGSKILTWHLCVTKAWKWARIYQFSGWLDRCIFFTICLISKFQKMSLSRKFNSKVETKNGTKTEKFKEMHLFFCWRWLLSEVKIKCGKSGNISQVRKIGRLNKPHHHCFTVNHF